MSGELTVHAHLPLRNPSSHPSNAPDDGEDNADTCRYSKHIGSHESTTANLLIIEKRVHIVSGAGKVHKSEGEIGQQDNNQPQQVNPRRWFRSRNEDLEKSVPCVEGVLADVPPGVEA